MRDQPMIHLDELREELRAEGQVREAAQTARDEAMDNIAQLVRKADGEIPVAEIARLTGVTRQTIYNMLRGVLVALVAAAALTFGAGVAQAKRPTVARANAALEKKVRQLHPRITRERLVIAECHRRTKREFFCLYGIHANAADAVDEPGIKWAFSDVGYVYIRAHGRLVARPWGPHYGDLYAPY